MERKRINYTDEQFIEAISSSDSICKALDKLGVKRTSGGNYTTAKNLIIKLKLDISHMPGRQKDKGKKRKELFIGKPLKEILIENSNYQSSKLKKRLIKENIFVDACLICKTTTWQDKPLVLQLDHINGNPKDNRLDNLRLLCPNCHSQTSNYAGKNIKVGKYYCLDCNSSIEKASKRCSKCVTKIATVKVAERYKCLDCGKEVSRGGNRCKSCAGKHIQPTKIQWPTITELIEIVNTTSYLSAGKKLGVSDNAVRKRIKRHSV